PFTAPTLPPSQPSARGLAPSLLLRAATQPVFPYATLFRSTGSMPAYARTRNAPPGRRRSCPSRGLIRLSAVSPPTGGTPVRVTGDRKSTRLNSSHVKISYPAFCLKKRTVGRPPAAAGGGEH